MLAPPEKRSPAADGNPGEASSINNAEPTYNNRDPDVKTFTSQKLEWLMHVSADTFVKPLEFQIAFVTAQHVNAKTGIAYLSDEVIAEHVRVDARTLRRGRKNLKDIGWISWTRTGTACAYKLLFERIATVADEIVERRCNRIQRREERLSDRTSESAHEKVDRTSGAADRTLASADRTLASAERTSESAIHLCSTPVDTPNLTPLLGVLAPSSDFNASKTTRKRRDGKRTRRVKTDLPDDWVLSDEQWAFAAKLGLTGDEIEEAQRKMKRWVKREGKRCADWNSFVEDWFEREIAFLRKSGRRSGADDRAAFNEFLNGDDHRG